MSNIDIYYTSEREKYGFFIQKRKHNGRDGNGEILALGQGLFLGGDDALLSLEQEILASLLGLKDKGLIDKKSNINFFYPELMNVDKKQSISEMNDFVKMEEALTESQIKIINEIRDTKTIFRKSDFFFHTSLINDKSRDVISEMKHEAIKKCLETNTFEISNDLLRKKMQPHLRKELLKVKGSKSLKGFITKLKPERRKKMRTTSDYKRLLSDVVSKEMSIDKRLNISDNSEKDFYDVNKVNSLVIYTDGSLSKKMDRNKHGYGVSVLDGETGKALFKFRGGMTKHSEALDHIQLVELYAIYRAALFIDKKMKAGELNPDASIEIRTDSENCVKEYEKYLNGRVSILGSELFSELKRLTEDKVFCLKWVKGHAEDKNNIEVDKLARAGLKMEGHSEYATLYSSPEIKSHGVLKKAEEEMNELMEATAHIETEPQVKRLKM